MGPQPQMNGSAEPRMRGEPALDCGKLLEMGSYVMA